MKGYFLPPTYRQSRVMQLQSLQQGDRFVDVYMEEFQYLLARNDVMEDEDQMVGHYLSGLWPSLRPCQFILVI